MWSAKGHTPVLSVPGQRQGISAALAVSAKGAFWFATYAGGLNGALFVALLRQMMRRRCQPLHLVVDGLPAHKTRAVRDYVDELHGKLTLHFLPSYALTSIRTNWSGATPRARATHADRYAPANGWLISSIRNWQTSRADPRWSVHYLRHPSIAYISDC